MKLAGSWQEALGASAKGQPVAMVLPLDTGFANDELELVSKQDLLGDRLVRRRKRRKDSDAFLAELSALNRGDLTILVHPNTGQDLEDHRDRANWLGQQVPLVLDIFTKKKD